MTNSTFFSNLEALSSSPGEGTPSADLAKLRAGAYYWVAILPRDGMPAADRLVMPARFTGVSGGSPPRPTWDFLGIASALEHYAVEWIGPEIARYVEGEERLAFESWWGKAEPPRRDAKRPDGYANEAVQLAWEAWQKRASTQI